MPAFNDPHHYPSFFHTHRHTHRSVLSLLHSVLSLAAHHIFQTPNHLVAFRMLSVTPYFSLVQLIFIVLLFNSYQLLSLYSRSSLHPFSSTVHPRQAFHILECVVSFLPHCRVFVIDTNKPVAAHKPVGHALRPRVDASLSLTYTIHTMRLLTHTTYLKHALVLRISTLVCIPVSSFHCSVPHHFCPGVLATLV